MWDKMKNKWNEFFNVDGEESGWKSEESTSHRSTKEYDINAKVAFHYPKKRSYRVPVMPDVSNDKEDLPAFKRKSHLNKNIKPKVETQSSSERPSKKVPNHKLPFEPSEVASPIYGYQPRKKSSTVDKTDIPAFERKREIKQSTQEILETKDNSIEREKTETRLSEENREQRNLQTHKETDVPVQEAVKQEEVIKKPVSIHEYKEAKQLEQKEVSEQKERKPENKISKKESVRKQTSESMKAAHRRESENKKENRQQKRQVPFNVMMTPRDKRNQFVKKKSMVTSEVKEPDPEYSRPPLHLLDDPIEMTSENKNWIKEQIQLLEMTLKHFHIRAKVVNAMSGPSVTRFEIQPDPGVKVSKIKNLSDDIKLNMAARDIRMEAPIPGKHTIGIEIPNPVPQPVGLQEIFESKSFTSESSSLSVALGLDIAGQPIVTNLNKMPHGLIAGATGSGKSVCINSILISLLYKSSHEDVKFLLIDPKMVELAPYNELPHLVAPVITDVKAATSALKWAVKEMEERYNKFAKNSVRDIERYNAKMKTENSEKMPYLIIVIDELADLMMAAPQDVEDAICRIAQKARACGIHLLLATQRPSVDVITGLIKANVPTRIAFSVSSQVDSRTILDTQGAEKLLGKGDMLFIENGARQPVRIQGAFVSDEEIERITGYAKKIAPPNYLFEQEQLLEQVEIEENEDELYEEAVDFVFDHNGASASLLQRKFKIGYNRAARLIDHMEANGIISEQKGSKPRDILITSANWEETNVNE